LSVNDKPISLLAKDSCSELARLTGDWFLKKLPNVRIHLLKGEISKNVFHDIIAVKTGAKVYLIDPTVWQFFPHQKRILIKITSCLDTALHHAAKVYGGKWVLSEKLTKDICRRERARWREIVLSNLSNVRRKR